MRAAERRERERGSYRTRRKQSIHVSVRYNVLRASRDEKANWFNERTRVHNSIVRINS